MEEITVNSITKNSILLSRNTPVALVVGAAGFLGSHLTESLLEKNIQVVGVDNFSTSNRENLEEVVKSKKFHLIVADAQNLTLNLERLDYIFLVAGAEWDSAAVMKLFREKKARCVFVSWINLYDKHEEDKYKWFKEEESRLAKFAGQYNLNARILRLGPSFGPRMRFETDEAAIRLIQAQLLGEIQKEESLEFSSRALYVTDAVDLIIKSMLKGATAQKIFDGVALTPVKVSEIKQILLDPLWHESRQFIPSELPPWPTPNLMKTMKFLNWRPKVGLVKALKETLSYFKDREINIPKLEQEHNLPKRQEIPPLTEEKRGEMEGLKTALKINPEKKEEKKKSRGVRFSFSGPKIYLLIATILIVFGIIYPIAALGLGILTFRFELKQATDALAKGEFDKSLSSLAWAKTGVDEATSIVESLEPIRKLNILGAQFDQADLLLNVTESSTASVEGAVRGVKALYLGLRATSGDINDSPFDYYNSAQVELTQADDNLSSAQALINSSQFKANLPTFFKGQVQRLSDYLKGAGSVVQKAKDASIILPKMVASNKSYLILLQNNMELRPTGGFIGSYGLISFDGGKLKKLEVNDVYSVDGNLKIHVEPPKEIKEDLGQKDWFLRDSNFEPDFPTSAKQAEWFFNQEAGTTVAGVFAMDVTSMENLLEVLGPIDLPDYNEKITSDNLFERAVAHAEQSFFPGSQAKKSFITALTNQALNKMFFLPDQNWPAIVGALGKSLQSKHISIFLDDPKLFSYVVSQNWGGVLPRPAEDQSETTSDFLAPVEANLGADKVNYYLDRSYGLATAIGKDGEVSHKLKINYTNKSPSDAWPGGKYKNRMRIYLPIGTKLTKALWGEADITKDVTSYVDYGRTFFSVLLELEPKEQKALILEYQLPKSLQFTNNNASYRLDVIKQAGTLKDPFNLTVTYPINYQLSGGNTQKIGPQEETISTDLLEDRSFEMEFTRD